MRRFSAITVLIPALLLAPTAWAKIGKDPTIPDAVTTPIVTTPTTRAGVNTGTVNQAYNLPPGVRDPYLAAQNYGFSDTYPTNDFSMYGNQSGLGMNSRGGLAVSLLDLFTSSGGGGFGSWLWRLVSNLFVNPYAYRLGKLLRGSQLGLLGRLGGIEQAFLRQQALARIMQSGGRAGNFSGYPNCTYPGQTGTSNSLAPIFIIIQSPAQAPAAPGT